MTTTEDRTTSSQRGGPSKTLRFRKGTTLLDWYVQLAQAQEVSLTEALLTGLAYYRAALNEGTAPPPRQET